MAQQNTQETAKHNVCSTVLSMDLQSVDRHSTSKIATGSLHHLDSSDREPASRISSNMNDDQNKAEQMDESAQNVMLQGSAIFDMLSAMQFTSASINSIDQDEEPNTNYMNIMNAPFTKQNLHDCQSQWHLHLYNSDQDNQDHAARGYPLSKDLNNGQETGQAAMFDPINNFLKLPVLADPTKLELADQRLRSSYSTFVNNYKGEQDPASIFVGNNNNNSNQWLNSLQLDTIRHECGLLSAGDGEDGANIVHYIDQHSMGVTPLETKFLMKLNGRDDTDIHAQREKAISDRYNQSVMNMFPTYNAGEQLMRNLSEGGDVQANREGEASVLENMQIMMMMGYGDGAREDGIGYKVTCKGSTSSASVNVGPSTAPARTSGRRRGVRGSAKNSEERETQRMTHIAVERNRRRQMNEHLRVLRALMPPSYVQRGDQASIIGGAIEFVRELEQLLQCLESQKRRRLMASPIHSTPSMQPGGGMNEYTSENQLVSLQHQQEECALAQVDGQRSLQREDQPHEEVAHAKSIVADIEVKMIDRCQAFIKILSQHRPRQLLHTIAALQDHLCFSILHTNVTTIEKTVLYSFTVKINNAQEYSANKIASTVQEVFIEIIRHVPLKRL